MDDSSPVSQRRHLLLRSAGGGQVIATADRAAASVDSSVRFHRDCVAVAWSTAVVVHIRRIKVGLGIVSARDLSAAISTVTVST